jgi:hypothetical protein
MALDALEDGEHDALLVEILVHTSDIALRWHCHRSVNTYSTTEKPPPRQAKEGGRRIWYV